MKRRNLAYGLGSGLLAATALALGWFIVTQTRTHEASTPHGTPPLVASVPRPAAAEPPPPAAASARDARVPAQRGGPAAAPPVQAGADRSSTGTASLFEPAARPPVVGGAEPAVPQPLPSEALPNYPDDVVEQVLTEMDAAPPAPPRARAPRRPDRAADRAARIEALRDRYLAISQRLRALQRH